MTHMNQVWYDKLDDLLNNGASHSPRGSRTNEELGSSVRIDMKDPILSVIPRNLGYKFMYRESWWILTGRNDVDSIAKFARIARYSDDGNRFDGAYGPKIVDQLRYVVDCLDSDPNSRQAVINIWRENPRTSKDIPCTLSAQFLIRDGFLNCVVTMRSSDIWLGLPYDVFNFTMLTMLVGMELHDRRPSEYESLELGSLYHTAGSRHLYAKDFDVARFCLLSRDDPNSWIDEDLTMSLKDMNAYSFGSSYLLKMLEWASIDELPEPEKERFPWLSL